MITLAMSLAGCAFPGSLAGLNAKQIEALAKIKDASVVCGVGANAVFGKVVTVFASIDKGLKGTIVVAEDCRLTVTTDGAAPK